MRPSSSRRGESSETLHTSLSTGASSDINQDDILPASEIPANASLDQLFSLFVGLAAIVHIPKILVESNSLENLVNKDVGASNLHLRYVGSGASFTVRALRHEYPARSLALKSALPSDHRFTGRDEKRRLFDIILELRALTHPPLRGHRNVIELLGLAWETDSNEQSRKWPVLIIEHADGGSLHDFLHKNCLDGRDKLRVCADISAGVGALHSCGIIHGDVKPQNILMVCNHAVDDARPTWVAKIADFGGAIMDTHNEWLGGLRTPSQPWNAPEWMERMSLAGLMRTDIYSLGLVFWSIAASGVDPFKEYAEEIGLPEPAYDMPGFYRAIQKTKLDGDVLLEKLDMPGSRSFSSDVDRRTIKQLLSLTVLRDPERRSLPKVLDYFKNSADAYQSFAPPRIAQSGHVALSTLEDASTRPSGIDTLDPLIRSYVVKRLQYTASSSTERWHRAAAAFTLAAEALAGGNDASNTASCLKWLTLAADSGNLFAKSLVYRFHTAFSMALSVSLLAKVKTWVAEAALKGYPAAQNELTSLLSQDEVDRVCAVNRFRYAGIGRNRFAAFYNDGITAEELDVKQSVYVQQLLEAASHPGSLRMNSEGDTILHFAACAGLYATVEKWLVTRPVDVNAQGQYKETPLLHACRSGHYHVTCLLLEAGADPRIASTNGDTPLHWLLSFDADKMRDVMQKLLGGDADPNAAAKRCAFDSAPELDYEAGTPLHRAVGRGHLAAVQTLLKGGASAVQDGNRPDMFTPLNLAAMFHYDEILEALLESIPGPRPAQHIFGGASLLIHAIRGEVIYGTAFEKIARHGSLSTYRAKATKCIDLLLRHGAVDHLYEMPDNSIGFGSSALFIAISYADIDIIAYLLKQPGVQNDINRKYALDSEYTATTPLHKAITRWRLDVFRLLLDNCADPKALHTDENGTELTYLYECAVSSHANADFARELLARGVEVDSGPQDYETPLGCAVRNRCFELATFLLEQGANPNIEFSSGLMFQAGYSQTLLGYIIQEQSLSSLSCLNYLFENCDELGRYGPLSFITSTARDRTVLHKVAITSEHGRDDLACKLILFRLLEFFEPTEEQINLFDADGFTALAYAVCQANVDLVTSLVDHGANPLAESPDHPYTSALCKLLCQKYMQDHDNNFGSFLIDTKDARPKEVQIAAAKRRRKAIHDVLKAEVSEDEWTNMSKRVIELFERVP